MKLKRWIILVVLGGLLPWACSGQDASPAAPKPAPVAAVADSRTAPAFKLPDLGGASLSLADFKGKPTVIVFTTTWCPYCIEEIPEWKRLYAATRTRGVGFAAVYIQESPRKVKAFARKHKLPYPVLLDADGEVARAYKVRGVPSQVLIDERGRIYKNPTWNLGGDLESLLRKP